MARNDSLLDANPSRIDTPLMRRLALPSLLLLLLACSSTAGNDPLRQSRQLIVVITPDWDAVDGTLERFERPTAGGAWRSLGSLIPIVVGRTGLAWGHGLNAPETGQGPVKREGDGKSPAGIFSLGTTFGFADPAAAGVTAMAYDPLTSSTECVDDSASTFYNSLVEPSSVPRVDWNSSEKMRSIDVYRWGVFVNHNVPASPKGGSCIFLHIWNGPARGTAGCTAMNAGTVEAIVHWLHSDGTPRLVQLPRPEYDRLRGAWHLP